MVVYVRDNLQYEYNIVHLDNIKLLQIIINLNNKKLVISALYRLHPTCPRRFNNNLYNYLKTIEGDIDYSILVGDININILDQKDYTQQYLNILHTEGYISQINKYTRINSEHKSCIDHIFVKQKNVNNKLTPVIIRNLLLITFLLYCS